MLPLKSKKNEKLNFVSKDSLSVGYLCKQAFEKWYDTQNCISTQTPWLISYFKWNGKGKDEIILKFAELYIWDYWDIFCSWNFLEKLCDAENLIFENMFILVDIPNKHCYHFYVTVNHLSQFIFCTLSMYRIDHSWRQPCNIRAFFPHIKS